MNDQELRRFVIEAPAFLGPALEKVIPLFDSELATDELCLAFCMVLREILLEDAGLPGEEMERRCRNSIDDLMKTFPSAWMLAYLGVFLVRGAMEFHHSHSQQMAISAPEQAGTPPVEQPPTDSRSPDRPLPLLPDTKTVH